MTTRVALVMAPLLSLIHMGAGNMGAFKVCVCVKIISNCNTSFVCLDAIILDFNFEVAHAPLPPDDVLSVARPAGLRVANVYINVTCLFDKRDVAVFCVRIVANLNLEY